MSTPPPGPRWTLTAKDIHGTFGELLVGCHIVQNQTTNVYEFYNPDFSKALASSPESPKALFTFDKTFDHNGLTGVSITMNVPVAAGRSEERRVGKECRS